MRCPVIIFFFLGCVLVNRLSAQGYDSIHVYALYMNGSYYVKMDKNLIKNEADLISIKEASAISGINGVVLNTVRGKYLKKIKSNNFDARLILEFFDKRTVNKVVGFTPYGTMFIDHSLYKYDKARLMYLDKYIPGLATTLGIKE